MKKLTESTAQNYRILAYQNLLIVDEKTDNPGTLAFFGFTDKEIPRRSVVVPTGLHKDLELSVGENEPASVSDSLVNEDVSPEDSDLLSKSGSDPLKWKGSTSPGQVSQRLKMSFNWQQNLDGNYIWFM